MQIPSLKERVHSTVAHLKLPDRAAVSGSVPFPVKTDQAHPFLEEPQIPSLLHAWNVHGTDQPLSTTRAIVHDTVPLPTKTDQAFEFEYAQPMTVLLSLLMMTVISLGPQLKYPPPQIVGHARSLPHSH
jgi:hypothetical protein